VPAAAQVQLLDLLSAVSDDIRIARVGSDHERKPYKVKVILAINEDIEILLREKRLRKDLYYRVRFIQKFPDLKERLAPDRDPHHRYLRGMLASYRWKSQASIEDLCESAASLLSTQPCFFPLLDMETLDLLAHQEWEGNFRELERVAFDLFQEFDEAGHQTDGRLSRLHIERALKSGHSPASYNLPADAIDGMTAPERRKLDEIQKALRDTRFVIRKAMNAQEYIKARETLRTYLRKNVEKLDQDIKKDSRLIAFLTPNNRRTIKVSTDEF
jgi:DNA-binding NtrC family response regulator